MESIMFHNLKAGRLGIAVAVSLLLAAVYAFFVKNVTAAPSASAVFGILSDSFLLPGALLGGIGVISWASTFGLFDMLSYGFNYMIGHFLPLGENNVFRSRKSFYDYRREKEEKGRDWLRACLLCGAVCLGVSILCLILYGTV